MIYKENINTDQSSGSDKKDEDLNNEEEEEESALSLDREARE